jgi:Tol biopolymer transport system component
VYGGSFSSDEERLIYSSNESGIYNVYEVGISSGTITKLSSSELESFFVQSYVPASNDFIYTADKGGNEINHLYLQKRGGQTIDLTPEENEKSIFYKWSQDNTFLYYLSNKRDSKYFDLYKMDIGRLESRMVYENKDNLSLSSISNNEQYLLLSERLTTSENKFYLLDY